MIFGTLSPRPIREITLPRDVRAGACAPVAGHRGSARPRARLPGSNQHAGSARCARGLAAQYAVAAAAGLQRTAEPPPPCRTRPCDWRLQFVLPIARWSSMDRRVSQQGNAFGRVRRAALSIWWALRTSACRGPNPSVDRRVRWMRRAPGWQGVPDGQQAKKLVVTKCLFYSKINIL